jgi:16S rRNA (cytosine967-C5)-methyltransferase
MRVETWHIQKAASQVVQSVLRDGRNLNHALEDALRDLPGWSAAQRAALQDLSFGTVRFYGQLIAVLDNLLHKPLRDPGLRYLLLVALYQLQYGKSASYAVVDHAVRAAQALNRQAGGLANAVLRNFLRNRAALLAQATQVPQGQYNHTAWWIAELQAQYGERALAVLQAGNQHPPMALRVNRRQITTDAYQELLAQHGLAADITDSGALLLDKPLPVSELPGFAEGKVSVQDAGAQYAAMLLDVHNGMRVLDACAAPGGKTAHILECADVDLLAIDKDEHRLERVRENLRRLRLTAEVRVGDAAQPALWSGNRQFDRILADVPCSASGVARRHPDIKWLRRPDDLAGFAAQQLCIVEALWQLLAQDGKLLYVTCSIFQQENEQVVTAFLKQHADARRLPIALPDRSLGQLLPNDQHDGFFYALLQKMA